MKRVIKADDARTQPIRPVRGSETRSGAPDSTHDRILELERALRDQRAEVEALRQEQASRRQEAFDEGFSVGLATADDRARDRLELLRTSLADALGDVKTTLGTSERLAALVARECLNKMLAEPEDAAELVAKLIARQFETLERSSVLSVRVAAADFDTERLAALEIDMGLAGLDLDASSEVASGGCRMELRLGAIDLGLDRQWPVLRDLLSQFASEAVAA
jgi:type III secretion protein L